LSFLILAILVSISFIKPRTSAELFLILVLISPLYVDGSIVTPFTISFSVGLVVISPLLTSSKTCFLASAANFKNFPDEIKLVLNLERSSSIRFSILGSRF
jgi:hypothetical protein